MSSRSPVRRYLSFEDLPYRGQSFYLDIKKAAEKNKLSQQIHYLGGTVEGFLSKELSLIITDRENEKTDSGFVEGKKSVKSLLPLSRGQALLKASQHQGPKDGHSQDLLHSAAHLGIKTQKASMFIRATSKLLSKIKSRRKTCTENDLLEGMSTIAWDKDKENMCIVKVEDDENLFRPLFKQFEAFPEVDYSQPGSPFDVGVVLMKEPKENNQAKKKSAGAGVVKGGFCESCDHWYKCTLREHLKSDKHRAFVKSVDNFRSLDSLVTSLPNLGKFLGKHGVEYESECQKETNEQNQGLESNGHREIISSNVPYFSEVEYPTVEKSTISETRELQLHSNCPKLSDLASSGRNNASAVYDRNLFDKFEKTKCVSDSISEKTVGKSDRSVSSERRLTLNEVLRGVFDADNAVDGSFNSLEEGEGKENCDPGNKLHKSGVVFKDISEQSLLNQSSKQCANINKIKRHGSSDQSGSLNNVLHNSCFLRQAPEASFSSSCSFGDHGVGNILSFLQSNDCSSTQSSLPGNNEAKGKCCDKEGRNSVSGRSDTSGCISGYVTNILSNFNHTASDRKETNSLTPNSCNSSHPGSYVSKLLSQFNEKTTLNGGTQTTETFIPSLDEPYKETSALSSTVRYCSSEQSSAINLSKPDGAYKGGNVSSGSFPDSIPVAGTASEQASGFYPPNPHSHNSVCGITKVSEQVGTPNKSGKAIDDQTPKGKDVTYSQPTLEDLCRSGSSIRNWLVPKDDDEVSVKTVVSKLDHTLTEMENSVLIAAKPESMLDGGDVMESAAKELPQAEGTSVCNLVANWIKTQEFNHNSETGTVDVAKTHSCDRINENSIRQDAVHSDVNVKIGRAVSSVNGDIGSDIINNTWTDTCSYTSVSDCTVFSDAETARQADATGNSVSVNFENKWSNFNNYKTNVGIADHQSIKSGCKIDCELDGVPGSEQITLTGKGPLVDNPNSVKSGPCTGSAIICVENYTTAGNSNSSSTIHGNISHRENVGESDTQNTVSATERPQEIKEIGNKTKQKGGRKPRQTKTKLEAKKRVGKAKQKSLNKVVTTQQMSTQLLPQSPTTWQNPYMNQVMYSPISMPSENAPVDPSSPYNQMWQKSAAYLSQAQAYSPSYQTGYDVNMKQYPYQGSVGCVNPGPLPAAINSPYNQQAQASSLYHQNISVDTRYNSSMLDLLSSPKPPFTAQNGVQQPQTSAQDYRTAQNPEYSSHNNLAHSSCSFNSVTNAYQYPGCQYPSISQHAVVPGSFAHAITRSPLPQTHQYGYYQGHLAPSPGLQQSDANLSTICLSDIAEGEHSNSMYIDSTRYLARPKRKINPTVSSPQIAKPTCSDHQLPSERNVEMNSRTGYNMTLDPYNQIYQVDSKQASVCAPAHSYDTSVNYPLPIQTQGTAQPRQPMTQPINNPSDNCAYNAVQTGEMKLRLCKMPTAQVQEQKSNLTHYWNVRKTGECRLVFSSNMQGKRKAEETPGKLDYLQPVSSPYQHVPDNDQQESKRRRCLVF